LLHSKANHAAVSKRCQCLGQNSDISQPVLRLIFFNRALV